MEIEATLKEREGTYGDYGEMATTTQAIKDIYRKSPNWKKMSTDKKESLDVIATKIGRILHGDPNLFDSWHDIEGYAKLIARKGGK